MADTTYCLLTGATGLVGAYLLADLLEAGRRVAVVVRSSRSRSAVERVEGVVRRREKQTGYALPRPVVLEGDITQPGLGLTADDQRWVAHHCGSVLHNAASLTFVGAVGEEPYISNIEGTRHILELCRTAGIRQFHHVSTAYVCGLRRGRILESEVDVGQQPGNDYEASKLSAEQMVRAAPFLDAPTIYRPGIIIGDSRSGYTSTFHGFYLPLRLVCAVYGVAREGPIPGSRLMQVMGLRGDEEKNLVPVDWVARAIATIFNRPACHGQTYHLTPRNAVSADTIEAAIYQAVHDAVVSGTLVAPSASTSYSQQRFEAFFTENMRVYQAYWRADPQFDTTNTQRALPELPCPAVDQAMLVRMCKYAIGARFLESPAPVRQPPLDVGRHLQAVAAEIAPGDRPPAGQGWSVLSALGPGGGDWKLGCDADPRPTYQRGAAQSPAATCLVSTHTLHDLVSGQRSLSECVALGHVLFEGSAAGRQQLRQTVEQLTAAAEPAPANELPGPAVRARKEIRQPV